MRARGPRERSPPSRERIEVRRLDVRITERGNRIRSLVVGDDQQDIRPLRRSYDLCLERKEAKDRKDAKKSIHLFSHRSTAAQRHRGTAAQR